MFRISDAEEHGLLPARDHRGQEALFHRSVLLWCMEDSFGADGVRQIMAGGDGQCVGYWPEHADNGREFGSFANVFPAMWAFEDATKTPGAFPVHDRGLGYDDRYRHLEERGGYTDRLPLTPAQQGGGAAARKSAALVSGGLFPADADSRPRDQMGVAPMWGRPVPVGQAGIVVPGTHETGLAAVFMPTWDGVLVAQHRGHEAAKHTFSTRVADMEGLLGANDGKALGLEDVAGLHSVWRVQRGPGATAAGPDLGTQALVAWLCTGARFTTNEAGYGAVHMKGDGGGAQGDAGVVDQGSTVPRDTGETDETRNSGFVNAFASHEMGGPFHPGREADAHSLGGTGRKGDAPWNSLHFQLNTLWYGGASFDAPLEFQQRFEPQGVTPTTGKPARVHLTLDPREAHAWVGGKKQGLWRWHVNIPILRVPPREPPFPPGPPFPPEGPEGPGGPGEPGGGPGTPPVPPETPKRGLHGPTAPQSPRRAHGTPLEVAFPALAAKPYVYGAGETLDMRYEDGTWDEEALSFWGKLPVVARLEAFGKQAGAYHVEDSDADPRYADQPVAPGGWFLLPGSVGMEDAAASFAVAGRTANDVFLAVLAEKGFFASGTPDFATGGVKSGFKWGTASDASLVFSSLDSAATATEHIALTPAGLLTFSGRTSTEPALVKVATRTLAAVRADGSGTLVPIRASVFQAYTQLSLFEATGTNAAVIKGDNVTANRTLQAPDADGTIALVGVVGRYGVSDALTGTTSLTTIRTLTVPAARLLAGGTIKFRIRLKYNSDGSTVSPQCTVRVYVQDDTGVITSTNVTIESTQGAGEGEFAVAEGILTVDSAGATARIAGILTGLTWSTTGAAGNTIANFFEDLDTIDTTDEIDIVVLGQLTDADDSLVITSFEVETSSHT